jgi:hypothetical protein
VIEGRHPSHTGEALARTAKFALVAGVPAVATPPELVRGLAGSIAAAEGRFEWTATVARAPAVGGPAGPPPGPPADAGGEAAIRSTWVRAGAMLIALLAVGGILWRRGRAR